MTDVENVAEILGSMDAYYEDVSVIQHPDHSEEQAILIRYGDNRQLFLTVETLKGSEETDRWIKKVPPEHICNLPSSEDDDTFGYGSIWGCRCGLEWVWSNGGGWLSPEEYQRRREQNDAEGIPNEPKNKNAHPFFRLPR